MQSSGSYLSLRLLLTLAASFISTDAGVSVDHAGKCYWLSDETETVSFVAAKQKCLERSSKMVQLTSQEVFDVVTSSLNADQQYWVGLTVKTNASSQVTEYYWDDNSKPPYNQWSEEEPNQSGDCVRLSRHASVRSSEHLLADNSCFSFYNFICEKEMNIGDYMFGNGQQKVINGSNYCPMTSYPAVSRLVCSGSCAQSLACKNFHFNKSSKSCTLYSYSYTCDVTMPDTIAVTTMNRLCV